MTATSAGTWFHTLATHYVEAQIYFHLNQAGVVTLLRERPRTVPEIAAQLELEPRVLEVLLEYAADVGELIERSRDGAFQLSPTGMEIVDHYTKSNGTRTHTNLFDVRIGAWGVVWQNLGGMLRKQLTYGEDFHRNGDFAADGLFKLAAPLIGSLQGAADRVQATTVVEIGPTSGLLAQLAELRPGLRCVGVDIKSESLRFAASLSRERGVESIEWVEGDLLEPQSWLSRLAVSEHTLFFSCHFHEFLSKGYEPVRASITAMLAHAPGNAVLILEQPRLAPDQRASTPATNWLYAQSNVLIHHLIRNARILTADRWQELLRAAGATQLSVEDGAALGFKAFLGWRIR